MPPKTKALHCAVSGEPLAAQSAIWLVQHPDSGEWLVDIAGKLPGGIPVLCEYSVLSQALSVRDVPPSVIDKLIANVVQQLKREALSWLPLALKAGVLVTGFDTVNKALRAGSLRMLLHASDASEDGLRKLAGIAKGQGLPAIVREFDQATLAAALGRDGALVHVGLASSGIQQSFLRSCQRLAGFSEQHKL